MDKPKQMIVMRRDLKMRKGKIAAQAGHACVTAVLAALDRENRLTQVQADADGVTLAKSGQPVTPLSEWFSRGVAKVCVYVDSEEELLAIDRKAKEAGISESEFVRRAAMDKDVTVLPGVDELVRELRYQGNNLNQLTVMARQGRIRLVDLRPFLEVYQRTWQALNSLLSRVG